ncbi:hypothetical protein E8E15_011074 [Penicillium rubens]|nr:hypothetical protein E8E15_011074 [Penicillium rubens]
MATNSTQNETPAWVAPVAAGGYGLIGLIVLGILGRPEPQPAGTDDNEAAGDRITRPVLPVFVEPCDTAAAEGRLEDVDCNGLVVRWVPVPRGHRLAKKTKKANALAEVVGALKGKN